MLGAGIERELLKEKERVGGLRVGSFSSHSRFEITGEEDDKNHSKEGMKLSKTKEKKKQTFHPNRNKFLQETRG